MTKAATTWTSPLAGDGFAWLDAVATPVQKALLRLYDSGKVGRIAKNVLHGTSIRHRVHPALVAVPIGAWTTGLVLDVADALDPRAGYRAGADAAVVLGIVSALPTVASGLTDWVDTYDHQCRVGMAHALTNATALVLYTGSAVLRAGGQRRTATLLSGAGFGAVSLGGILGGELVYTLGVNVNNLIHPKPPTAWVDVAAEADLQPDEPHVVEVGRVPVLLRRHGTEIAAVENWCPHAGAPLSEGTFTDDTVTCPWHASCFSLTDGHAIDGPAAAPLRTFDVRQIGTRLEVRPNDEARAWPPATAAPASQPMQVGGQQ